MSYFSKRFEEIIESSGKEHRGGFLAVPSFYSGRGVRAEDLNSGILEKLYHGIQNAFGTTAAQSFVALVADVQELSATNFLMALRAYEAAAYDWNPKKHSKQLPFCQAGGPRRDMEPDSEKSAMGGVLSGLASADRLTNTRSDIAGAFLEAHGSKLQIQAFHGHVGTTSLPGPHINDLTS